MMKASNRLSQVVFLLFFLTSNGVAENNQNILRIIGIWDVRLVAQMSTCANVKEGDIRAFQMTFSKQSGKLTAEIFGATNLGGPYVGNLSGDTLFLYDGPTRYIKAFVHFNDTVSIEGYRLVANRDCGILYTISGIKR